MNDKAIAIFDSGVGGLSCAKELLHLLPNEDIIYLGDTLRMPYGVRSKENIIKCTSNAVDFLQTKNIKLILAACGTVSCNAYKSDLSNLKVNYLDLITPTVLASIKSCKNKKIGVIATQATINTDIFAIKISEIDSEIKTLSIATQNLVTLIETEHLDDEIIYNQAYTYLKPMIDFGIDTLILGCTHFPLIAPVIQKIMGDNVTLINSGSELAKFTKEYIKQNKLENTNGGKTEYYVTDKPETFNHIGKFFIGNEIQANLITIKE